jgi:hypothetical protein
MDNAPQYFGTFIIFMFNLVAACYNVTTQRYELVLGYADVALWALYHSKD